MTRIPDWLATHEMRECQVRSFRFARAGTSAYSFTLTWVPGKLVLSGDIGDLILTHGCAAGKFDHAIRWAADSDLDYLMGKTGCRQAYDANATLVEIIRMANEPVKQALQYHQQDLRSWRRDVACGDAELSDRPVEEDPRIMNRRADYDQIARSWFENLGVYVLRDLFRFDDCWDRWFSIWQTIYAVMVPPGPLEPGPEMILTHKGRATLARMMTDHLGDAASAATFCSDIGLDDYDGEYVWTDRHRRQIDAIRHGCALLIAGGHIDMTGDVP